MKAYFLIICSILCLATGLSAQKNDKYTVLAGTRVQDCIPFLEQYRYPEFREGTVLFKNGVNVVVMLNYNLLHSELQYIQLQDTLSIANEKDIKVIAVAGDTFYFDKGYLEMIYNGPVKVALKQYIKQMQVIKKDSYGSAGSNSATDSYNSIQADGQTYKLILNHDRIFNKIEEYYLVASSGEFVPFTKKKVFQLFPQKKKAIEAYLKSKKVYFDSREDLLRFAAYLIAM